MSSDPRPDRNDHDIATLIRAAGKRPAVPPERQERVRAAAHEAWVRETRRASRRRQAWIGGALAAAAVLVLAIGLKIVPVPGGAVSPAGFTVESLSGTAWATPQSGEPDSLAVGAHYAMGSEVRTTEATRVALRLDSGHSIRLGDATRIRIRAGGILALDGGTLYVDSGSDGKGPAAVTVETPFGRIEEIGTQFEVHLTPDAVRVRLREGAVILHDNHEMYPVAVGTEFSLSADGSTASRTVPAHDDVWSWVAAAAPPFELEGRTARSFLDWVARERGLRLVFSDTGLAAGADDIVLSGKLEGVSVEEALDVVLPTCRMSYRIADGLLTIQPDPSAEDL